MELWRRRNIEYDPATRLFAVELDGEVLFYARTPGEGDTALNELLAEIDAEIARLASDEPAPLAA